MAIWFVVTYVVGARPVIARNDQRPVCPSHSPGGSARSAAIATAVAEIATCSPTRTGMPSGPLQCAGSANQAATEPRKSIRRVPWPTA